MTWNPDPRGGKKKCKRSFLSVSFNCEATLQSTVSDTFAEVISHLGLNKGRDTKFLPFPVILLHGFHLGSKVHPEAHSKFNHKHQFEQWKLHDYIKYNNCYIH